MSEQKQQAKDQHEDQEPQDQETSFAASNPDGLVCTYKTDEKTGVTTLTITGTYSTTVKQEERDGKIIFTSPDFKAPQADLKSALEWVGRNVGTRTVRAEYDRQNAPLDGSTSKRASKRASERERIEQIAKQSEEQTARMMMALEALTKQLQAAGIAPSDDQQPALKVVGR